MTRTLCMAAVRLSNEPTPTPPRLAAAETQIARAADQGAQIVVLPEVFNTGYVYDDANYARAEPLNGPTVTWMRQTAARHGIHLAGSLFLLGAEHITNSLILVAPDGRLWRYDKNHPWVWERAYFRAGTDIMVADTDLGRLGMLICVDVLSPRMFERYAGRVDALIVSASPPRVHDMQLAFPDGFQTTLGALMLKPSHLALAERTFGEHVRAFAAWMGVPVALSTPYGNFASRIPAPWLSCAILLARHPALWRHLPGAGRVTVSARYFAETQIVSAHGDCLARFDPEEDGFALATVDVPDLPPRPKGHQPKWAQQAALLTLQADSMTQLLIPTYRRGIRWVWGRGMAPVDTRTRILTGSVLAAGLIGYIAGRLRR